RPAQLAVLVPGLDQHRRPRVAFEVAHLLRLGIGPDPDLAPARHEPEWHRVRPAAGPEAGDEGHALALQQLQQLGVAEDDLVAAAHPPNASGRARAATRPEAPRSRRRRPPPRSG